VLRAAAQHPADPVERVIAAAAMPKGLLLHAAANVVHGGEPEPGDWNASSTRTAPGSDDVSAVA